MMFVSRRACFGRNGASFQMVPGNAGQLQAVQLQTSGLSTANAAQPAQTSVSQEPTEEEPLYVNAKQYNRILKRRAARAKLESEGRIPRERKVRLYTVEQLIETREQWK
jgi:hypothetical protein